MLPGGLILNVISENARVLGKVKAEHVIIWVLCVGSIECGEATQRQTLKIAAANDRSATVDIPIEANLCPTKETS